MQFSYVKSYMVNQGKPPPPAAPVDLVNWGNRHAAGGIMRNCIPSDGVAATHHGRRYYNKMSFRTHVRNLKG